MIEVLIVEDDPMVAELNRRYLERIEGFVLAGIVQSGNDALAFLQTHHVDLVLLDVFMPGMNGLELLTAIRSEQYGVDVILVTAARDNQSVQQALRQGAVDYLIKPFEFTRFQAALLAFKKRKDWMGQQDNLCQQELDKQIFSQTILGAEGIDLPKGLDRNTLKRVWEQISQTAGEFTADDMAKQVGISQVSMRKYLKYFLSAELLYVEISYGAVGRPLYRYRCLNPHAQIK